ncbi:MAG: DM13 domain-containing protein [Chloroflexota bacterium]|nr:DM13 domain-containing protein [Chloroflexota bacterium]
MILRRVGVAGIVACVVALAWYLGSPLFLRTTVNEALPTARPTLAAGSASVSVTASPPSSPVTLASGELGRVDALHNGTGAVLLVRTGDLIVLRFENVAITNAPDVHVYLSSEQGGRWNEATSVYLGPLKATDGSFNYVVPGESNSPLARSVVVWCRQFSVLVTWADLH